MVPSQIPDAGIHYVGRSTARVVFFPGVDLELTNKLVRFIPQLFSLVDYPVLVGPYWLAAVVFCGGGL